MVSAKLEVFEAAIDSWAATFDGMELGTPSVEPSLAVDQGSVDITFARPLK